MDTVILNQHEQIINEPLIFLLFMKHGAKRNCCTCQQNKRNYSKNNSSPGKRCLPRDITGMEGAKYMEESSVILYCHQNLEVQNPHACL